VSKNNVMQARQILLDPVAQFSAQYPEADADKKSRLEKLWDQVQSLREKTSQLQLQAKITSRKIGEAKKNNQLADKLIESMHVKTADLKRLEVELKNIEDQVLVFFDSIAGELEPKVIAKNTFSNRYASSAVNIDEITIGLLENEEDDWNEYVGKQPEASIHHLTHWRHVLQKTYGINSFYFFAHDKNLKVVGILPLVRLKSGLFGDILVSMPYFQRGGAIADHPYIESELMEAASREAARLGVDYIEYRDDVPREGLPVQLHKVNMVLLLPDSEEALWNSFTAKLRAQIKRPQQQAPQVLVGGKEYLDDFYKVYTRNMRDLGSPCHSKKLVENILNHFPDNSWIVIIRLNNKPVSAGLLLGHSGTMEIPLASTIRDVNPYSINMLLYWEVLKLATRLGYKCFDFGRSSKCAGTYRFKQQWGAQEKQLYWYYWLDKGAELPSLSPTNPKYALIINAWKRLPVVLAKWLGPFIVKNIP